MVGHCIQKLVQELQDKRLSKPEISLQEAQSNLSERQDRDSLIALLSTIVPSCKFYFATRSKDGDLADAQSVASLFNRVKPTHVIHLAAKVGGLFANMNDKVGFFEQNVAMNSNVIRQCYSSGVKKLVCVLSTCIYPD